jgi:hypothetical protein
MSQFFINTKAAGKDRFDMSKFMEFSDNYDPLNSRFLNKLLQLPVRGQIKVTAEEARPDQLSVKVYGDPQYWWILMFYNRKQDTDDIAAGENISFPSLQELEDLLFSLKAKAT